MVGRQAKILLNLQEVDTPIHCSSTIDNFVQCSI